MLVRRVRIGLDIEDDQMKESGMAPVSVVEKARCQNNGCLGSCFGGGFAVGRFAKCQGRSFDI